MEIDKKSIYWKEAPWYVKFSAFGVKSTENLEEWSFACFGFALITAVTTIIFKQPPYLPFALFIGAYFYQKSLVWFKTRGPNFGSNT